MIIDEYMFEFLSERSPLMIHIAVADGKQRPYSMRGFGTKVSKGSDDLRIYFLTSHTPRFLSAVNSGTGIITGLFTDGRTNESYQLKGSFVECSTCRDDAEEGLDLQRYREGSMRAFPKLFEQFPLSTAVCSYVSYQVTEIYIQTPGPNAGITYGQGG